MSPALNASRTQGPDRATQGRRGDLFLEAWRNWRQGRTREEAEAQAVWLCSTTAEPFFAGVAQRELDQELR